MRYRTDPLVRRSGGPGLEPFYFGERGRRLFGIYHPAAGGSYRGQGVVLCEPLGQEQIRVHRAFLVLAQRLASAGLQTLRFNYLASGDSEGKDEDASFEQWQRDISAAVDELKTGSDASRFTLVGLRLGASLAMLAGSTRKDIEGMVLWDGVVDGAAYLAEIDSEHRDWLRGSFARSTPDGTEGNVREILGFPLPERLAAGIEAFQASKLSRKPADRILVIDTDSQMNARCLVPGLQELGCAARHEYRPAPAVWRKAGKADEFNQALVPIPVLDAIVAWITETA